MTQEQIKKLRDELIENKGINSFLEDNPFVGIYFEDLCKIISKVIAD